MEENEEINTKEEVKKSIESYGYLHDSCPEGEDPAEYEDYTEEEVNNFSLEMRCCYYLCAYNKRIHPQTIEEWAKLIGWIQFDMDGCFYKCAVRCAIESAERLIEFVKKEKIG